MTTNRGAFIVLEGLDRCGKTTQLAKLQDQLTASKVPCKSINFPDRTTMIGGMINSYLKSSTEMSDNCIHLLFSTNRWEAAPSLVSTLQAGTTVICDRYAYSGVAFTAAKNNVTTPYEWCKGADVGLPRPDAVVFLTVSEEVQEARGSYGDERYETTEIQRSVRTMFDKLKDDDANTMLWTVVNADGTMEEVAAEIQKAVNKTLERVRAENPPIAKLWTDGEF